MDVVLRLADRQPLVAFIALLAVIVIVLVVMVWVVDLALARAERDEEPAQ